MSRTSEPSKWFRMYSEFIHDPKVQMLSEVDQRRFIMLLCVRCGNGDVTLHDEEVAFLLRIDMADWEQTKVVLLGKKLIGKDNKPTAWEKRQYSSDSSAERVARHRNKVRNGDVTLQSRPVEADTDTEADTETPTNQPSSVGLTPVGSPSSTLPEKKTVDRGSRLPTDWVLPKPWGEWALSEVKHWTADDVRYEADQFRDHWVANANQRNAKKSDWEATWRNWVRRNGNANVRPSGKVSPIRPSSHDLPPAGQGNYGTSTPLPAGANMETLLDMTGVKF